MGREGSNDSIYIWLLSQRIAQSQYGTGERKSQEGGEANMAERIIDILDGIAAVRGQEYVEGLVDMANLLAPRAADKTGAEAQETKKEERLSAG